MNPFDYILHLFGLTDQTAAYTSATVTAIALLGLGRIVLPPTRRRSLRFPVFAFVLHLGLMASRAFLVEAESSLAQGIGLFALFLLLISIGRSGVLVTVHLLVSRHITGPLPKIFTDIVQGGIYAGALFVTLSAAGVAMDSLLTTSALLTAVIGLSLQDTLGNLFAGLAIQVQHPFEVGDWIQFDDDPDNTGMVIEINWRAARVLTLDQIEVIVPNNQLARAPIRNFTKPMRESRRKVFTYAPYSIPPRRIERYIVRSLQDVPGVLTDPAPSVIPYEFDERGVQYQVRYFIRDFMNRENIDASVRERIWYALSREGIEIPVPQRFIELHEGTKEEEKAQEERHIDEREAHLRIVPFLDGLPGDAVRALAEKSEIRLYDDREAIIRQGDHDTELFIVVRGTVAVLVDRPEKDSLEVAQLGAGQFFGEMSLMTGARRTATVRALGECELVVVDKDAFHHIFDVQPELMQRMSMELAAREKQLGEVEREKNSQAPPGAGTRDRSAELLHRIRHFFSS